MGRCQILLENEISIFKKLVSRRKHEVLQNVLVNGWRDVGFQKTQWTNISRWRCSPNHHRLWKLNTGLQATGLWASPPFLQTLGPWFPNEIQNLLSSEKRTLDHWTTVQFFFSLVPGKTPLTTTVAKFLDTSVCGVSWCLDPSLSPFLVKFTQILESILLDNPHKAAVLSVDCPSFSTTLLSYTQLSVNMLGYSTLWTASFFGNERLWRPLLVKGVNDCLLDNCQISSLPHDCVA